MNERRRAQTSLVLSAVAFSTAGLFVGLLDNVDVWTILFWRSLFALGFTLLWAKFQVDGRATFSLDRPAVAAAVFSATATLLFIPALKLTSVADVAVIHGALPLLTAALARLISNEPVSALTLGLCATITIGALVIFAGSASSETGFYGDSLALAMTASMALMTIAFSRSKGQSLLTAVATSNATVTMVAAGFMPKHALPLGAFALLAAFALCQMTFGLLLFAGGARVLAPTETAIVSLAEVPLSPLWVWIAFGSQPRIQTVLGGGLILTAVLIHLFIMASVAPAPIPPRPVGKE
jgi:drug/metabolite transporter (DMT)-like permease